MSLDTIEQKNIPVVKEWGYTPIQGFADGGSFGTTESGDVVHIADTSTWAGVFKNGLSVVGQYELKPPPVVESAVQTKKTHDFLAHHGYDELFTIIDALDYKEKKVPRGPRLHTPRGKKREKEARAKKKTSFKKQSTEKHEDSDIYSPNIQIEKCGPDQLTCTCYKCIENRREYTCGCCGKVDDNVQHYNSVFSKKGSMLCPSCYKCEACPGCGWEAGGLCRYCRLESRW